MWRLIQQFFKPMGVLIYNEASLQFELGKFLQGDMGESFKYGKSVQAVIGQYMWLSFGISFAALILEMIIAIPLGIKCAVNQYGKLDYIATVLCMVGIAFPSFFLGTYLSPARYGMKRGKSGLSTG